ncbi:hypothetical protein LINGRAHAP2_LOCUS25975 [Linum grandiflorum]
MAAKFHYSLFIIILLFLGAATMMVERVEGNTCSLQLYPSGCVLADCDQKCKEANGSYVGLCVPNPGDFCVCAYQC